MRKLFPALLIAALTLAAVSCKLSDITGIGLDYNVSDPWSSWEKVEPGIYVCIDDDFGKGDLIAKGKDNSMVVCNTDTSGPVPRDFKAFDGDKTAYTFSYGTFKGSDYLKCTISLASEERGATLMTTMTDIKSTKALWGANCSSLLTFPKKYKKVHAGGNLLDNYKWICQKYQSLPYAAPEDQLVESYMEYGTKWSSARYPSEMDSKGWVIPYTGPGKFEYQEICQQIDWDGVGNRKILWGGCHWGKVDYVRACVSGLTYEEAASYVAKVKSLAKYNVTYEDVADGSSTISFNVWSDDRSESTEGFSGYIYPSYKIVYTTALTPTLTIEFAVCYITYV